MIPLGSLTNFVLADLTGCTARAGAKTPRKLRVAPRLAHFVRAPIRLTQNLRPRTGVRSLARAYERKRTARFL